MSRGSSPDVATPQAFKETVLRAPTISYPDPVAATVSGGYIESVVAELGIKETARGQAQLKAMATSSATPSRAAKPSSACPS